MKRLSLILLLLHSVCFAQPGPPIPFSQVVQPLNDQLEQDPNNDEARLNRIHLYLHGGNYSYDVILDTFPFHPINQDSIEREYQPVVARPIADIQYLERRWKDGKNKEFLTPDLIHSLYGEAYENSDPELSKVHYLKAAKSKKEQRFYEGIFNAYNRLNQIDSALLYHDSLNLLFHKNSVRRPRVEFYFHDKIELLKRKREFTQELVNYYNWLSTEYFAAYEVKVQETEEGEYISKSYLESAMNYQYDLCDYYFKHDRFKEFEALVNHLGQFIPRNKHGVVLNLYPYHRYFKIAGNLALHKGKRKKAIRLYLQAANHPSFHKDTTWSAHILKNNPKNPDAHILHGLVLVNRSRQGYWFETAIREDIMKHFDKAKKMGSNYYVIDMMRYFNLVVKKEFIEAEKLLNKTIASNPHMPRLYNEKYQLNRKMYWNELMTEEELEKRLKTIREQADKWRIPLGLPSFTTLRQ